MEWISVKDKFPENDTWVDIWDGEQRIPDVKFRDNDFLFHVLDHQGDFSHFEVLSLTHWMLQPKPPIKKPESIHPLNEGVDALT